MTERERGPGPDDRSSAGELPDGDTASPESVRHDPEDPPKESRGRRRRSVREERLSGRKPPGEEFRVPAWVVVPLTTAAGFFVSGWPGAVFGLVAGGFLWWSRR